MAATMRITFTCPHESGSRVDVAQLVALAIGVFGIGGLVFTALRYNRDDTTAIVSQQAQITAEMKTLNDELRSALERVREERDALLLKIQELTRG